jgi:GTPase SAR1 family protein
MCQLLIYNSYLLTVQGFDSQEGKSYADENGLFFMETSAKTAQNVNELFYEIARSCQKLNLHSNLLGCHLQTDLQTVALLQSQIAAHERTC